MRRSGRRLGATLWLTAVLSLVLTWGPSLHAQSSDDPFGQSQNDSSGNGSSSSGSNNNVSSGTSSSNTQSTAPTAAFNPTMVPTYSAHNLGDYSDSSKKAVAPAGAANARLAPPLSEFEKYVNERAGRPLPRFGSTLLLNGAQGFAVSPTATVPPDYTLNPGDELLIGVTGSVEADLQLTVDPEGQVFIPRVGPVSVAGVRYGDLAAALKRRFNAQYKRVNVSVVIGHLHGLTIYVTGYAVSPGAYTISSLSTMIDAVLAAGGPAGGGSFRQVQLRRSGQLVTTLDLYDLLLNGDKSHDASLLNGDVLNIEPVGPELAITGSVNQEAIYEARPGETLGDMLRYAGGPNSLADESRLLVARLSDLDKAGSEELTFAAARAIPAERGDLVRVLSLANIARPQERQAILATIEGEIDHPGRYYLRPGSTVGDLLAQAGGMTPGAFVYGTEVNRDSLRVQQQASFDRAIAELQLDAAAAPLSDIRTAVDRGASAAGRTQAALAIIDRLKAQKPDGRLVLALAPDATSLPAALTLENNDRIYVPPRPKTIGVFGAVYETGSFLYTPGTRLSAYLRLAGGPKRIAERGDIFVVRANGSVLSTRQTHDLANQPALPGDVIFVPVKTSAGAFEKFLLVAQVVSQFAITGLTLAALGL
ncbi:MAG TPA: SLBB domain-containing protein [Caulobacteraceae bacterium]|nr:SLBB domain-containing protein [Caulobacteraceae bacterium]